MPEPTFIDLSDDARKLVDFFNLLVWNRETVPGWRGSFFDHRVTTSVDGQAAVRDEGKGFEAGNDYEAALIAPEFSGVYPSAAIAMVVYWTTEPRALMTPPPWALDAVRAKLNYYEHLAEVCGLHAVLINDRIVYLLEEHPELSGLLGPMGPALTRMRECIERRRRA